MRTLVRTPLRTSGIARTVCALAAAAFPLAIPDARADAPVCDAWDVEYAVSASMQLSDTAMGAGDGVYPVGPGRIVLRMDGGEGDHHVRMLAYEMRADFTVVANAVLWKGKVKNETLTTAAPSSAASGVAEGTLTGRTLQWGTPVNGMRSDGKITCEGSLCGKFGAPPEGTSDVHNPPHNVQFNAFSFAADQKTFTMPYAVVAKAESPKQTSRITLAGREIKRTCASH